MQNRSFEKAALKEICDNAQVMTGALYKRYGGKEELFSAVVAGTVRDMEEIIEQKFLTDRKGISDEALVKAQEMGGGVLNEKYENECYCLLYNSFLHIMILNVSIYR